MSIDIKLYKKDLPDDLILGNVIAVDGEFMGLNVRFFQNQEFKRKIFIVVYANWI